MLQSTGGMGLISTTISVLLPTQVFASKLRALIKKLSVGFCEYNNDSACMDKVARCKEKYISQESATEGCSLSLSVFSRDSEKIVLLVSWNNN